MNASLKPLLNRVPLFFSKHQRDTSRVFHGRGHLYPSLEMLCIDWYSPVVLISLFAEFDQLEELSQLLVSADVENQIEGVILQKRYEHKSPSELLWGVSAANPIVTEEGLKYLVKPGSQQNSGLFLDMQPLRSWLVKNSQDKNVLNLFAYTCSLSVAAMAGGASHVTNVDMSKTSIEWGRKNHELNDQPLEKVTSIPYNIFTSWGRIQQYGRYDTVVIDPPARQRGSFDMEKNYGAVIRKLPKLCLPGADIIASVNSPFLGFDFLPQLFEKNLPQANFIEMMPVSESFEEKQPEKGLKLYRYRMPNALR